ncbi:MAG: T9SS type A sorting domain-containing protein [Chitinivibrionia bacterium]|nr:T9SS type A sorting domain-containing protein [Chitinivibrionia bacterium]
MKDGIYTAQLYNLQGRLIKSADINAINGINAAGIRIYNLSKGIFILNVKQAGATVFKHKITVK